LANPLSTRQDDFEFLATLESSDESGTLELSDEPEMLS